MAETDLFNFQCILHRNTFHKKRKGPSQYSVIQADLESILLVLRNIPSVDDGLILRMRIVPFLKASSQ